MTQELIYDCLNAKGAHWKTWATKVDKFPRFYLSSLPIVILYVNVQIHDIIG